MYCKKAPHYIQDSNFFPIKKLILKNCRNVETLVARIF